MNILDKFTNASRSTELDIQINPDQNTKIISQINEVSEIMLDSVKTALTLNEGDEATLKLANTVMKTLAPIYIKDKSTIKHTQTNGVQVYTGLQKIMATIDEQITNNTKTTVVVDAVEVNDE